MSFVIWVFGCIMVDGKSGKYARKIFDRVEGVVGLTCAWGK